MAALQLTAGQLNTAQQTAGQITPAAIAGVDTSLKDRIEIP